MSAPLSPTESVTINLCPVIFGVISLASSTNSRGSNAKKFNITAAGTFRLAQQCSIDFEISYHILRENTRPLSFNATRKTLFSFYHRQAYTPSQMPVRETLDIWSGLRYNFSCSLTGLRVIIYMVGCVRFWRSLDVDRYQSGHNGPDSKSCCLLRKLNKNTMEAYRSGHNELDSKSCEYDSKSYGYAQK